MTYRITTSLVDKMASRSADNSAARWDNNIINENWDNKMTYRVVRRRKPKGKGQGNSEHARRTRDCSVSANPSIIKVTL